MATDRERILELVGRRPGIGTVQISDALDLDVEVVDAELIAAIGRGHVQDEETTIGDRKRTGYRIKAGLGWTGPAKSNAAAAAISPAPAAAKPVQEKQATALPAMTKVAKAIAYLTQHRSASKEALKAAMGLKSNECPSQYLKSATVKGLVSRDGQFWHIGPGEAAAASPLPSAAPERTEPPAVPQPARAVPHSPRRQTGNLPQTGVLSSLAIGDLRIILWVSGNLVVSANDNTVELRPEQMKALRAFVELT